MTYRNPVFELRDSVWANRDLQEKALDVDGNTDFLSFAAECGHSCTMDDLKAAIDVLKIGGGTLPLAGHAHEEGAGNNEAEGRCGSHY